MSMQMITEQLHRPPPDMAQRVRLASAGDTPEALLDQLVADPDVTVRAALALNAQLPPAAERRLAGDGDARVRALLGGRLAALCPEAGKPERAKLRDRLEVVLGRLVDDEAVRVRLAIAEVLQDMPGAPRALILRLARDADIQVAGPVIRLSPVLTDDDLLTLLASRPEAARMVAARDGLPEALCDAVAASADTEAVRVLLENQSAAIREATLDALVAQAEQQTGWHAALVRRPVLSPRAIRALAGLVTNELLDQLAARPDLPMSVCEELRLRVAARLANGLPSAVPQIGQQPAAPPWPADDPDLPAALRLSRRLRQEQRLDEAAALAALRANQPRMLLALIAIAADQPPELVHRAASMRSPKALVSLVWKAGFPASLVAPVQALLGQVPPDQMLVSPGGGFPLTNDEMTWQVDFLRQVR